MKKDAHPGPETPPSEFFGSSLARDRLLLPFLAGECTELSASPPSRESQRKAAPVDCNAVGLSTLISLRCVGWSLDADIAALRRSQAPIRGCAASRRPLRRHRSKKGRSSGQSQKGSIERAASRCLRTRVPIGGTRNRERPFHAASSVLRPPLPRHQLPPQGATQPPYTRPAPSRGKRVERAGIAMSAHPRADGRHTQPRSPVTPPVAFRTPHAPRHQLPPLGASQATPTGSDRSCSSSISGPTARPDAQPIRAAARQLWRSHLGEDHPGSQQWRWQLQHSRNASSSRDAR